MPLTIERTYSLRTLLTHWTSLTTNTTMSCILQNIHTPSTTVTMIDIDTALTALPLLTNFFSRTSLTTT
ncbi:MAG: hypothetical protein AAGJ35_12180, partial [Myxococcota bacterium]